MANSLILVLICSLFSFACALIKRLYDARYYPKNMYIFTIDATISGISGIVLSFIISEHIKNGIAIIGLSGLGGMFGVSALKSLIKLNLGKKINIQLLSEDDNTDVNGSRSCLCEEEQ